MTIPIDGESVMGRLLTELEEMRATARQAIWFAGKAHVRGEPEVLSWLSESTRETAERMAGQFTMGEAIDLVEKASRESGDYARAYVFLEKAFLGLKFSDGRTWAAPCPI